MAEVSILDHDAGELAEILAEGGVVARPFHDPDALAASAPGTEVLLASPPDAAQVVSRLASLRWIQSTWAGVDALIQAGVPDGVALTGVRGVFGTQMREFVFGHLLAHAQRVVERTLARRWDERPPPLLAGTTMGVLGTGSIGRAIAATGRHLGLSVRGCSRSGAPLEAFDLVFPTAARREFAAGLDHLVAALPATPDTDRLVDAELLSLLSPGATFVNVGRGTTADLDGVVEALGSGRLALAVLDVLPQEPLPSDDPLWRVDDLVITSHTAAWSRPADIARLFLENHARYLAGEPLHHMVDLGRGY